MPSRTATGSASTRRSVETNIRDHHKAERIRAELEAKRIHEEIEKNLRDGPPPPRRGK